MRQVLGPLLLLAVLLTVAGGAGAQTERIPEVHGTTFSGATVDLPAMLKGRCGVLVLGFSKEARPQATAWGKRLAGDYFDSTTVLYYELPMLGGVPKMLRGMVLRSMKTDVSERGQAHFVPVTEEEARWRALAQVDRPNDAYVLVVDGNGDVRGRLEGEATDAAYADLRHRVEALQQGAGR